MWLSTQTPSRQKALDSIPSTSKELPKSKTGLPNVPLRTMFCLVSSTPITQGSLSYKTTPADGQTVPYRQNKAET